MRSPRWRPSSTSSSPRWRSTTRRARATMQADSKSYDDINVTPMVDLYLVLLLIFIIMTTAGVQGVKVNLPKAGKPSKMDGPKMQAVTVENSGNIKLNATPISITDLETQLSAVKART